MKLIALRPMIWTADLTATVDFYIQVLGFSCENRNDSWGWAAVLKDDIEIMIALPNEHTPFHGPKFTGSFYMNTDDVDTLWLTLKDKATVAYPIDNFEYGMREFAIYDNNGYLLQFGQEIEE